MKQVRKMIVTDLDGTLLHNDKTVSEYTKNIINEIQNEGHVFVIATARPIRAVKKFLKDLNFDAGIYHNGAVIMQKEKHLGSYGIDQPYNVIKKMLSKNPKLKIAMECDDTLYSNFDAELFWPGTSYTYSDSFSETINKIADKILLEVSSLDNMKEYEEILPPELYIQMSENKIGMIMNKKATKIDSIRLAAKKLKINPKEIYAFGDDYNDIDMLEGCSVGVAVGNSLEIVKKSAKYICDTNENDGVAKWIEKNILKKV